MNNKDTSGPAFPGPYVNDKGGLEAIWKQGGMTLRDYFAAKAMHTFLSIEGGTLDEDARLSYVMADCMLKARDA